MTLQIFLWQFVKFTFTDLGPAFAKWAKNWYWSPPGKSLIVTPPYKEVPPLSIWKSRPTTGPEKWTLPHLHGERRYHVSFVYTPRAKILTNCLKFWSNMRIVTLRFYRHFWYKLSSLTFTSHLCSWSPSLVKIAIPN